MIDRFAYHMVGADPLQCAHDGRGKDRSAGLRTGCKDAVDPLGRQAGTGGVVNGDDVDLGSELLEAILHRVGPLGTSLGQRDPHEGKAGPEFLEEGLAILRGHNNHNLLDVVAVGELLSRVEPDWPASQRCKRLFVVGIPEAAALAGRDEDHTEPSHGVSDRPPASGLRSRGPWPAGALP